MTTQSESVTPKMARVLTLGAFRSVLVNIATYPIEVVKTNQQANRTTLKAYQATSLLFKADGMKAFYRGFAPHLTKAMIRQSLWWPAIAYIPPILKKHQVSSFSQHVITGFSIATLDAAVTAPLEKRRILASITKKASQADLSITKGWSGFFPYWKRQGVAWSLLLMGIHHFEKPYKKNVEKVSLTGLQVITTASKLSFIATLCITPLDTLNTLSQSRANPFPKLIHGGLMNSIKNVRLLYRGFPLNFCSMILQTSATVFLMDRMKTKKEPQ